MTDGHGPYTHVRITDRDREAARSVMWRGFLETAAQDIAEYREELLQQFAALAEELDERAAHMPDDYSDYGRYQSYERAAEDIRELIAKMRGSAGT